MTLSHYWLKQFGKQPWAAGQTIRKSGILVQLPFPLKFQNVLRFFGHVH